MGKPVFVVAWCVPETGRDISFRDQIAFFLVIGDSGQVIPYGLVREYRLPFPKCTLLAKKFDSAIGLVANTQMTCLRLDSTWVPSDWMIAISEVRGQSHGLRMTSSKDESAAAQALKAVQILNLNATS